MKDFFVNEDKGRDHERSKSLLDLVGESKLIYLTSIQHKSVCGTETAYNLATSDPNKVEQVYGVIIYKYMAVHSTAR